MSRIDLAPFHGGRRAMVIFAIIGAVGLLATALGAIFSLTAALYSYLLAFCFWVGLTVGALILVATFHASNARWVVVGRRTLETISSSVLVFAPLFLPIAAGLPWLYLWVDPPDSLTEHARHLLEHQRPYLNVPFFLIRAALYFAIWITVSHLLRRWSIEQDTRPNSPELTFRQRKLSAGALPFLGLSITFAAFDWLMSLQPSYFSTLFGGYFFAGSFAGSIALWILVTAIARDRDPAAALVTPAHFHNMGKLLLAFVAFWAYLAYCQYMLTWIADLPEEVPWYLQRTTGGWRPVAVALAVGHFAVPFAVLLSQRLKLRPRLLAAVAAWVLLFHLVDVYWLVMPSLIPQRPTLWWTDLTALAGVGGVAIAFAIFRARGSYALPIGDPYLPHSLQFTQP
jgi:hypothetical protein